MSIFMDKPRIIRVLDEIEYPVEILDDHTMIAKGMHFSEDYVRQFIRDPNKKLHSRVYGFSLNAGDFYLVDIGFENSDPNLHLDNDDIDRIFKYQVSGLGTRIYKPEVFATVETDRRLIEQFKERNLKELMKG